MVFRANIIQFLLAAFIYFLFFPILRLVLVGGDEAKDFWSILITFSPDLLCIGILALSLFDKTINWASIYKRNKLLIYVYVSIIIYGGIMNILNGMHLLSFIYGFRITYFPIIFYFLFDGLPLDELNKLLKNVFNVLFIYCILSIIFHLFFGNYERYLIEQVNKKVMSEYFIPRTGGFILTPVVFSVLMALAGIYWMHSFVFSEKKIYQEGILILKLTIIFLGITFSVSRAGIVGLLAVSFIMAIFNHQKWKRILFLMLLFYVIFVGVLYLSTKNSKVFLWAFQSTTETVTVKEGVSRVELWKKSIQTLKDHILGYGIGKAGAGAVKYFNDDKDAAIYTTDGWPLKIWNELGIITGSVFLIFIFFISGLKVKQKHSYQQVSFYLIVFIFLNTLVNNIFDFYPYNVLFYLMFSINGKLN